MNDHRRTGVVDYVLYAKKAFTSLLVGVVGVAGYLLTILSGDDTLGDVSTVQWIGCIVFLAASYGFTFKAENEPKV